MQLLINREIELNSVAVSRSAFAAKEQMWGNLKTIIL